MNFFFYFEVFWTINNQYNYLIAAVLYALSAVYFAGVMVRLMLTLTPIVCILSGIAFSKLLEIFLKDEDNPSAAVTDSEEQDVSPSRLYDKVKTQIIINFNVTNRNAASLLTF